MTGAPPRLLSLKEAAAYCRLSARAFLGATKNVLPPVPGLGPKRWDIKAIDQWLDRLSGLESDAPPSAGGAYEARKTRKRDDGEIARRA